MVRNHRTSGVRVKTVCSAHLVTRTGSLNLRSLKGSRRSIDSRNRVSSLQVGCEQRQVKNLRTRSRHSEPSRCFRLIPKLAPVDRSLDHVREGERDCDSGWTAGRLPRRLRAEALPPSTPDPVKLARDDFGDTRCYRSACSTRGLAYGREERLGGPMIVVGILRRAGWSAPSTPSPSA